MQNVLGMDLDAYLMPQATFWIFGGLFFLLGYFCRRIIEVVRNESN